jgi:hypothetical protein
MAPPNRRAAPTVSTPAAISPDSASSVISVMFDVPVAKISTKMPNRNGMSPVFVVMKALIPASEFVFSSHQCPMRRYEQMPTSSHPTSNWMRLLEMTRRSIDPVNSDSAP